MVALQQTTRTVPIIFVSIVDPVGAGFVESLARPGGNVTGFSLFEYGLSGKWPELLKEIATGVTRTAIRTSSGHRRRTESGPKAAMRRRFLLRCTPLTHPRPAIVSPRSL